MLRQVPILVLCVFLGLASGAAALVGETVGGTLPETGTPTDDGGLTGGLPGTGSILPTGGGSTSDDDAADDESDAGDDGAGDDQAADTPSTDNNPEDDSQVASEIAGGSKDAGAAGPDAALGQGSTGQDPEALAKALATPGAAAFIGPVFGDDVKGSSSGSSGGDSSDIGRPAARDVPATPGLHLMLLLAAIAGTVAVMRWRRA